MALGTFLMLDFNFSGTGAASLPLLTETDFLESSGSLLLLEARHPLHPLPAGVPANGSTYPNLFSKQAAQLLGTTDTGIPVASLYNSTSEGKVERTAKGGLHAIQNTAQTGSNHGLSLRLPDALTAYMRARPNNDYYISQWGATSRPATGNIHAVAGLSASTASSYAFALGSTMGSGQARKQGRIFWPEAANTPNFRNAGVGGFHEDFISGSSNGAIFEVGNFMVPNIGASRVGTHGGQVFYRGYIEDLTVSGRKYEDVDALDYAEYTKQVMTPGGRYYADSWS